MIDRVHAGIAADLKSLQQRVWHLLRELERNDLADCFNHPETLEQKQALEERIGRQEVELHEALAVTITALAARLLLYTEALSLPGARDLVMAWQQRWSAALLATTNIWSSSEADGRESSPFNDLNPLLEGVLVLVSPEEAPPPEPTDRRDHERLEYCLRSLAKVCRERNITPGNEYDVQHVLHSHLEGVFPDYTRNLTISKPLVSFRPDGGVVSLKAAIECKFVATQAEVAVATHGLTEDLSGVAAQAD